MRVLLVVLALSVCINAHAADPSWSRVTVPPVKTGIYVGSVTLITSPFERQADSFSATYEAKVRPWFFWNESGKIRIDLPPGSLERLNRGETVEFTGAAENHKRKPRRITGRAQPSNANSGKMKVRIHVDDVELIFNSSYRFE